jgi:glutamine amidotransferase
VIATQPLTDNETWTRFAPGDLLMFQHGNVVARANVPVPPEVLEKASKPLCDGSPQPTATMLPDTATLDLEADDQAAFES